MKHYGKIALFKGDITTLEVDVIVNAANRYLKGGGGVDGVIHRKGGKKIGEECRLLLQQRKEGTTGQVYITTGGHLQCSYIFHAVGPIWMGGTQEEELFLQRCYMHCFDMAFEKKVKSIAFPCISTGAYSFPKNRAARVAITEAVRFVSSMAGQTIEQIVFSIYDEVSYAIYDQLLEVNFT